MAANSAVLGSSCFSLRSEVIPAELNTVALEMEIVVGNILAQGTSLLALFGFPTV